MLKVAIIGLGVMGKNHLKTLKNIPNAEVIATCDPISKSEPNIAHYRNLDALLKNHTPEVAIIATPTSFHVESAKACMQKGINVLIEKPLARNLAEARELKEFASKMSVKAVLGHVERFNPVITALKNELKDKTIYAIHTTRISPFPARIADVGVLADLGVHDIDLIRFLSRREITESHIAKSRHRHATCEDSANISLKLQDDILAHIRLCWLSSFKQREVEILCKEGVFRADLIAQELKFYTHVDANSFTQKNIFVKKGEALAGELESFFALLRGESSDIASIDDGIETLKFI